MTNIDFKFDVTFIELKIRKLRSNSKPLAYSHQMERGVGVIPFTCEDILFYEHEIGKYSYIHI